jgi:hypothetical protein
MSDTELLPKPKRSPGRFTGWRRFTGAERRRRWTAEQAAPPLDRGAEGAARVMRAARRYARLRAGTG